jgi:hypothetical protein
MARSLCLHFCEAVENTPCGFRFPPLRHSAHRLSALYRSTPGPDSWWYLDGPTGRPVHALDHLLAVGTTVREMSGPCLLVPIIFFFSAACAEKLREASAGRIKVAATRAHTLRMLLWRDGEFIPLASRNLQYRIKENSTKALGI